MTSQILVPLDPGGRHRPGPPLHAAHRPAPPMETGAGRWRGRTVRRQAKAGAIKRTTRTSSIQKKGRGRQETAGIRQSRRRGGAGSGRRELVIPKEGTVRHRAAPTQG